MKRKKLLTIALATVLCVGLVVTVLPSEQACAKVIKLKFANYLPGPAGQSKICEEFIAELQARTGGMVEVSYFPGGSLLKAPAMIKGIESGIADIGFSHIEYTPGRFPVMEAAECPWDIPPAGSPTKS